MSKLYLLFSHNLTPEQTQDAQESLGITNFVNLPEDLQRLWSNVPPDKNLELKGFLQPIMNFILQDKQTNAKDYALIQGDFGATYAMIPFCKEQGVIPIYATTERKIETETLKDGNVQTKRIFRHVCFREYRV